MTEKALKDRVILIRGAGEMATGVACRLFASNLRRILMLETASPLAVRRNVSFCEAVYEGCAVVEGVEATLTSDVNAITAAWEAGKIAVQVDPRGESVACLRPDVFIDATLAKRNLGLAIDDAPLVVGLGPGFEAGIDCHVVIETNRGHNLGRLLVAGSAEANTGIPGEIKGFTSERVLRAPVAGRFATGKEIGDLVGRGDVVGRVGGTEVRSQIAGIVRGLIRPGTEVSKGLKIGDIDPRGERGFCDTISEKARALGGSVLEAIMAAYNV